MGGGEKMGVFALQKGVFALEAGVLYTHLLNSKLRVQSSLRRRRTAQSSWRSFARPQPRQ